MAKKMIPVRETSRAEEWHHNNGIFLGSWWAWDGDISELERYIEIYNDILVVKRNHQISRDAADILESRNMNWITFLDIPDAPTMSLPTIDNYEKGCIGFVLHRPYNPPVWPGRSTEEFHWDDKQSDTPDKYTNIANNIRTLKYDIDLRNYLNIAGIHPHQRGHRELAIYSKVNPDVLISQIYPFEFKWNNRKWVAQRLGSTYWNDFLRTARNVGQILNKPYWLYTQTMGKEKAPTHRPSQTERISRLPSITERSLQIFAPLTYGFTGIIEFRYGAELFFQGGTPNEEAFAIHKEITRRARNLGIVLGKLRNLRMAEILHTDAQKKSEKKRQENAGIQFFDGTNLAFSEHLGVYRIYSEWMPGNEIGETELNGYLVLAVFQDDQERKAGRDGSYLMILNTRAFPDDTQLASNKLYLKLHIRPGARVHQYVHEDQNARWKTITTSSHTVPISGGSGSLFKMA